MRSRMSVVNAWTPAEFNAEVIDNSAATKDASAAHQAVGRRPTHHSRSQSARMPPHRTPASPGDQAAVKCARVLERVAARHAHLATLAV
jgi:hypothetical protein